jgi:hypothetical protein
MRDKHLGKCRLVLKDPANFRLVHLHDHAFGHGARRRQSLWLSDPSLADEFVEDGDNGFLALRR